MFINIACGYEWIQVNGKPEEPYRFPDKITNHMKTTYNMPAVYRWVIESEVYYVGETVDLCKRISQYVNAPEAKYNEAGKMIPHQQTTNINMNARLRASKNNHIEFFKFDKLQFGDAAYSQSDLVDKHVRSLVEKIAIIDHVAKQLKLLNK